MPQHAHGFHGVLMLCHGEYKPTARRIGLGHELRQLRKGAGLTIEEAARGMKFDESTLQRVETGWRSFRQAGHLRDLLERYGVTDEEDVDRLLALQRDASSREWWTDTTTNMLSGMPRFLGVESAALEIRAFHPVLVPGLLQTEAYARAVHETHKPIDETTTEFIQHSVQLRMKRKEALTQDEDPTKLWAVLYEPALRYVIGDPDVMREQYEELIKLAALAHVTIQVLPRTVRGYVAIHDVSIMYLGDKLPTTVQVDTAWFTVAVTDKPREVNRFSRMFDAMVASALPPRDTPEFLHQLSREITE